MGVSSVILSIFLMSMMSAIAVYSDFQGDAQSKTIENGQSINFNVDFFSMHPPMIISARLYDSSNNLIYTFLDSSDSDNSYSNIYTVSSSIYQNAGSYEIRVIGTDSTNTDSEILTLTVTNPVPNQPNPTNNAPVITSVPITEIYETELYSYDVNAVDADGNSLTYSLVQSPTWLSINPSTGLISGIAPLVNTDNNYNIIAGVSDGTASATQTFTILVRNRPTDLIAPVITIISPEEDREYNTDTINLRVLTNEEAEVTFRLDEGSIIEMNNPSDYLFTYTLNIDSDGDHIITFYAEDVYGNIAIEYARFSIDTEDEDDSNEDENEEENVFHNSGLQNEYHDYYSTGSIIYTEKPISNKTNILVLMYTLIGIIGLGIIFVIYLLFKHSRKQIK